MHPRSVLDLLVRDRAIYEVTAKESLHIKNLQKFRAQTIDQLVWDAVFADSDEVRNGARWIIRRAGLETGVGPSSIHELYLAYGRKECGGFAVPAINVRGLSYDVARAVIRAAQKKKVGAFIFELARTESGYTSQRPAEFAAVMIAAAIREEFEGPLFIQGDHYQVNPKKHAKSYPDLELQAIRDLCRESVEAGYYNIDIDTSTLVDYSKRDLQEQQRANFGTCAQFAAHVRSIEPQGVTVSLGGEIGEVGKKNSNERELDAYMHGFQEALRKLRPEAPGISKISVQTGTSHGGVVLPDGSMASVAIDFDTLRKLSAAARERYGLAGAVQHGASTLPADAFHKFVECGTAEVHLAT
jgi:fructose/tagatose bisphosphate aldolase